MDTKRIGNFLRILRKEKGLTQEQLAEILSVSGRTISRWETGMNMPDLSILIQIAEFYDVEMKEILNGERKGGNMDKELKETLTKVADYSKYEKQKAAKISNIVFSISFALCTIMIIIQLILTEKMQYVVGETVVLLVGGFIYIGMKCYNGIYDTSTKYKNSPFTDAVISIVCAVLFTVVLILCYNKMGADTSQTIYIALAFFVGISLIGFCVLRLLTYSSKKRKEKIINPKAVTTAEQQEENIYVADGNMQANMIINTLKDNGIMAYGQDLGDAGFAAVRYGMGRGIDDRIAIIVSLNNVEKAKEIIKEMGFDGNLL